MLYGGIASAVKAFIQKCGLNVDKNRYVNGGFSKVWKLILFGGKKAAYFALKKHDCPASVVKWEQHFDVDLNWLWIFRKVIKTTLDPQLRWFQLRLLHRLLPTNRYLHVRKLADTALCSFCNNEDETIVHLFWECTYSQIFWTDVLKWITDNCQHCNNLTLSKELVIFGVKQNIVTDKVFDLIMLLAKFHIYKCKLQTAIPNKTAFVQQVKYRYIVESYSHALSGSRQKFAVDWLPYINLVA